MCCRHFASTHDENPAHWQYFTTKAHRQKDGNGSHSAGKVVGDILCIFLCLVLYSITQLFSANEPGHDALYTGSEHSRHLPNVATFLSFSIILFYLAARLSFIAISLIVAWSFRKPQEREASQGGWCHVWDCDCNAITSPCVQKMRKQQEYTRISQDE